MDRCAGDTGCGGVVYGANLTFLVASGNPGNNCLLKNDTWDASEDTGRPWVASAVKI
jgi:hypothetical protein